MIPSLLAAAAQIYFATDGGGVNAYSPSTSAVRTVVDSNETWEGIAVDSVKNRLYYSTFTSNSQICRAAVDGSGVEALQSNTNCELNLLVYKTRPLCLSMHYSVDSWVSASLGRGLAHRKLVPGRSLGWHLHMQHFVEPFDLHGSSGKDERAFGYCA